MNGVFWFGLLFRGWNVLNAIAGAAANLLVIKDSLSRGTDSKIDPRGADFQATILKLIAQIAEAAQKQTELLAEINNGIDRGVKGINLIIPVFNRLTSEIANARVIAMELLAFLEQQHNIRYPEADIMLRSLSVKPPLKADGE